MQVDLSSVQMGLHFEIKSHLILDWMQISAPRVIVLCMTIQYKTMFVTMSHFLKNIPLWWMALQFQFSFALTAV